MTPKDQEFKMVPLNGLEPLLPCGNQILNPRLQPTTLNTIDLYRIIKGCPIGVRFVTGEFHHIS